MAQIFRPSANVLSRLSLAGALVLVLSLVLGTYAVNRSPYVTQVAVIKDQPVPFSHKHHVKELGIDCRYCHTSVEESSNAGMPPTYTCMSCHSQVWTEAPMLSPVRQSLAEDKPLSWTRIHDVPDFVYFNHSIHVNKGVGCASCHGQVDDMPLMWKAETMTMDWCLGCHREPEKHLRPEHAIFDLDWNAKDDPKVHEMGFSSQAELGNYLKSDVYNIPEAEFLTSCSVCHR